MSVKTVSGILVEYISHMGNDLTSVNAAKVSYGRRSEKMDDKAKKLMAFLLRNDHLTPFEHNAMTVRITCPIYIARQIFRHRSCSFNEKSRRYTKSDRVYYIPRHLSQDDADIMEHVYDEADAAYEALLAKDYAKEDARAVLPQALMTEFYMTANLRNWMHFLELRMSEHAQREAQVIAKFVSGLLELYFPETMRIWSDGNKCYLSA